MASSTTITTTTVHPAEAGIPDLMMPLLQSGTTSFLAMSPYDADATGDSYSYLDLLSRISRPRAISMPLPAQHETVKFAKDQVFTRLLGLPLELRSLVLTFLSATDLLNLRLTNHNLHNLVHESEAAVCAAFSKQLVTTYDLHPDSVQLSNLADLVRADRQYREILATAKAMGERLAWCLKSRPHLSSAATLQAWQERIAVKLAQRLAGVFIYLQLYLNFFRETLIRNEDAFTPLDDKEYTQLHNIFDLDQQDFLDREMFWLQEDDFVNITCVLNLLVGVCKGRNVPFKFKSSSYPFASVRQILIYYGLAPLAELIPVSQSLADQAAVLRKYSDNIGHLRKNGITAPSMNGHCVSIQTLIPENEPQEIKFDQKRGSQLRDTFIFHQDLWDRSARAHMLRKNGQLPALWSAKTWLIAHVKERLDSPRDEIMVGHWDQPNRQ